VHRNVPNSEVRRSNSSEAILQHPVKKKTKEVANKNESSLQNAGVCTVSTTKQHIPDSIQKQLSRTKKICLQNANVCNEVDQKSKGDIWSLLAQIVDNVSLSEPDDFDGWGVPKYGPFGQELIANILRYYEAQGDVQMLATIVCVLSGGIDRRKRKDRHAYASNDGVSGTLFTGFNSLLPDDDDRYDAYLYRYSALLYRWGQLTIRAELNKHLAHSVPGAGGEQLIPVEQSPFNNRNRPSTESSDGASSFIPNEGVASGITFAPLCSRCNKPISETNVCETCKDYAFRCSICTNAVRGLFTVCMTCGHGGHVEHIQAWFSKNSTCPSGCGCSCTLGTHGSLQEKFTPGSGRVYASNSENSQRLVFGPFFHSQTAAASRQVQESSLTRLEMLGSAPGSIPFGAYQPISKANESMHHGSGRGQRRRARRSFASHSERFS